MLILSKFFSNISPERLKNSVNIQYRTVASMASFSTRKKLLRKVVKDILPQIDVLNIYLNDYEKVPKFLKHPKINAVLGKNEMGDLRDNGKVFFAKNIEKNSYHFFIDDDLKYPTDYVEKMITKLKFYDNKVVVGLHGVVFPQKIEKFFKNRTVYDFRNELKNDKFVNLLGTGTVVYHSSLIDVDIDDFETKGMADVWFAVLCKTQEIPLVTIERKERWLTEYNNKTPKLWDEFKEDDEEQTKIVKQYESWDVTTM